MISGVSGMLFLLSASGPPATVLLGPAGGGLGPSGGAAQLRRRCCVGAAGGSGGRAGGRWRFHIVSSCRVPHDHTHGFTRSCGGLPTCARRCSSCCSCPFPLAPPDLAAWVRFGPRHVCASVCLCARQIVRIRGTAMQVPLTVASAATGSAHVRPKREGVSVKQLLLQPASSNAARPLSGPYRSRKPRNGKQQCVRAAAGFDGSSGEKSSSTVTPDPSNGFDGKSTLAGEASGMGPYLKNGNSALEFSSEEIEDLLAQKVGSGADWCHTVPCTRIPRGRSTQDACHRCRTLPCAQFQHFDCCSLR